MLRVVTGLLRVVASWPVLGVPVGDVVEETVCIGEANTALEDGVPLDQLYLSSWTHSGGVPY